MVDAFDPHRPGISLRHRAAQGDVRVGPHLSTANGSLARGHRRDARCLRDREIQGQRVDAGDLHPVARGADAGDFAATEEHEPGRLGDARIAARLGHEHTCGILVGDGHVDGRNRRHLAALARHVLVGRTAEGEGPGISGAHRT